LQDFDPAVVPAAVANVATQEVNGNIQISWSAPYNGGAAITAYKILI
jgi:hypothetical protein